MRDQVVMSKTNGQLAIAIPLYRRHYEENLGKMEGYSIALTTDEPLAYVIDCGPEGGSPQLFNTKFCESNLTFLGDL